MADLRGSTDDGGDDATRIRPKQETVILPGSVGPPGPVRQPAKNRVQPDPVAEKGVGAPPPADGVPPTPVAGVIRYGPGVPAVPSAGQGGRAAEQIWGEGAPPNRSARWRRLGGWAFTALLIVTSGVVLFARFHHAPFSVTDAAVSAKKTSGCRADVTARVKTNGAAGTITYRWQFTPGGEQASTLHQSVSRGQHAADLVITLEVAGHGGTTQTVVLQILDPDPRTVSVPVALTC
ncbi:hypothetical protein MXD62_12455 [Frankia sp. Mgl5]|uniref:hypothetical protein n=1 Tax=Frankia sp. Mgl5 TaxID=2933793 RepID=UPI00200ED3F3|nr:hypothetical protein [Frankia sp. Mgl5]MCK9927976.1 hypothetical protein [Frankia sp. Mgl5]